MPADRDDPESHARHAPSPDAGPGPSGETADALLADLPAELRSLARETSDDWLRLGLRLALEHPELARRWLESIAPAGDLSAKTGAPAAEMGAPAANSPAAERPTEGPALPLRSRLLAQSARTAAAQLDDQDAAPSFAWAATLAPADVVQLGRAVDEMLRGGVPAEIARGFGIVWNAGVRLPHAEQAALIGQFIDLEITVAGVLTGRDLRAEETAQAPRGLRALFDLRLARAHPGEAEAAGIIQRRGETVQHGLVALWNAWMALRYRERIPAPTFELLVRPWVTVVGPLPEP